MSLRFEDRLDGVSNYLQWKVRLTAILKENKIWQHVSTTIHVPVDPIALDLYEVKEAKAQRIILDGVKDHLIPHLAKRKIAKEMWDTLQNLFEAKNENRKMALRDKLHSIKMEKGDSVSVYLTKLTQIKDELATVGETLPESELVRIALNGFTDEWSVFVKCIVGREKLPSWSRLWDDFTQEEIREGMRKNGETRNMEEDVALASRVKGKGKKKIDFNKV